MFLFFPVEFSHNVISLSNHIIVIFMPLLFFNSSNITPRAMVKVLVNSSVDGKCVCSVCSLATDVKAE